jgi:hypothetical protein
MSTQKQANKVNYIVQDNVTGTTLYGLVLLKEIRRTQKSVGARIYSIPAEAWIAFLRVRYSKVPEVQAYLEATDIDGINPKEGAMLEAIDQEIDIPEEEFRHGMELCGLIE